MRFEGTKISFVRLKDLEAAMKRIRKIIDLVIREALESKCFEYTKRVGSFETKAGPGILFCLFDLFLIDHPFPLVLNKCR